MCMEDVQIGRSTQTFSRKFTLLNTATRLLPNNPQRFSLRITPPSSGIMWIGPMETIAFGQGYVLAAGDHPLIFLLQRDGQQLTGEWWGLCDNGSPVVWLFEEWFRPCTARFPEDYPGGGK